MQINVIHLCLQNALSSTNHTVKVSFHYHSMTRYDITATLSTGRHTIPYAQQTVHTLFSTRLWQAGLSASCAVTTDQHKPNLVVVLKEQFIIGPGYVGKLSQAAGPIGWLKVGTGEQFSAGTEGPVWWRTALQDLISAVTGTIPLLILNKHWSDLAAV